MAPDSGSGHGALGDPATGGVPPLETTGARVVPPLPQDVFVIARNMRLADILELEACGLTPLRALERSVKASEKAFTVLFDGVAVAMFGVRPIEDDTVLGRVARGEVWFLTGEGFERRPLSALKLARRVIRQLLERYDVLLNFIDGRYTQALRFAAALGATFHSPVMIGGQPFVPFTIRRP